MSKEIKRKTFLYSLVILGIILVICLLGLLLHDYYPQIKQLFDPKVDRMYLRHAFRNHGIKDACYLIILTGILTAIPGTPVAVVCIFNGVLYGPWKGLLMNLIGEVLGNLFVVYLLSHFNFIKKSRHLKKQLVFFKRFKNLAVAIILGYAIPFIPASFTGYVAVKMKMKLTKLTACIALGTFPTAILYAFGGDAVFKGNKLRTIIIIGLILLILIGFVGIYRKFTARHHIVKSS